MTANLASLVPAVAHNATALLFVEDPGAALFMQSLPQILESINIDVRIIALKHAQQYFLGRKLEEHVSDSTGLEELLTHVKPNILIVGTSENPDSLAFPLIEAARSMGIVTLGAVDAIANAGDRFRGRQASPLHYAPDWLLVPDGATRDAYVALGLPLHRVAVCGHPRMEQIAAIRARWNDADRQSHRQKYLGISDPDTKVILFASELSVGLNTSLFQRSPDYTLTGNPDNISRTEIVLDELLAAVAKLDLDPFLVLRLHPKQTLQDGAKHAGQFDHVSHTEPMLEMIHAADLVIGMTSILLVEAAALGRPVLSVLPVIGEREWLGELGRDIDCVSTPEEIFDYLSLGSINGGWVAAKPPQGADDASGAITAVITAALQGERP